MKLISIVIPTFNEEKNISLLIDDVISNIDINKYKYEIIVIDNSSNDKTVENVKLKIKSNKNIKLIINSRNFGHLRSPFHGILQAKGDAVILINADFQDPPHLIKDLLYKWENNNQIILLKKRNSHENKLLFYLRSLFYKFLNCISETKLSNNTTGSGLFDKSFINSLKKINDPYPYFRGLIHEITDEIAYLEFDQPVRKRGKSKNNFYTLYDIAVLGVIKHSKIPIRFMIVFGLFLSFISVIFAIFYLILKLLYWDVFEFGLAPLLIGIFTFGGIQLLFLGILGEYILSIHTQVRNLPLVIEKERINFE